MADVVRTALRILTFRATRQELLDLDYRHLFFGLVCTWLVGIGRYWDNPKAHVLQHLGAGSVVYVFVLGALLTFFLAPLRPLDFGYRRLVTFLTLVSPPAVLYAIPVERVLSFDVAQSVNVGFLGIVALWRVALLFFFVGRLGRLHWAKVLVGSLLPLAGIVALLTFLNLEHAVFAVMGGFPTPTVNDGTYALLILITMLSMVASPVLLVVWVAMVVHSWDPWHRSTPVPPEAVASGTHDHTPVDLSEGAPDGGPRPPTGSSSADS